MSLSIHTENECVLFFHNDQMEKNRTKSPNQGVSTNVVKKQNKKKQT